ncbi:MAG: sigma factor-like helix-turn-helix DNA-binding protein [Oscillospiraceae bacterium]|nr:DNA-binding protein [Oscillospiraceae bacterium]MBR0451864.1 DNA-binding protein [Oscillospiraceae bacterium]MDO5137776.1 sigma factor-like helix-turn-helix DNA-binding protein [Oscillospiraceae bacterium]
MAKDLGLALLIDTYGACLTDKQRSVLEMYYFEDMSLGEIAELEGISRQGVRDSIKRGEYTLKELEDNLQFAQKFENLNMYTRAIRKSAKDILAYVDTRGYTEQIRRAANDIVECADSLDKYVQDEEE